MDLLLGGSVASHAAVLLLAAVFTWAAVMLAWAIRDYQRISHGLRQVPMAHGHHWLLGHALDLLRYPTTKNQGGWDLMEHWLDALPNEPVVRFRIVNSHGIAVSDPEALKHIFQRRMKAYSKDLGLAYKPFLPILGSGLVTSDGDLWQKQRTLMGPALRVDILDAIIPIAKAAVDRLSVKLEAHRGTGQPVNIEEEFRLLTLQVIGDAILSMKPEQCDEVFPTLYLPVMEEANRRVLRPYLMYLPTPSWFDFRSRIRRLDAFLIGYMRTRWEERRAGRAREKIDILDRILEGIEESKTPWDAALEQQLCYEMKTFLLAGHETSAAMLTWSTYELSQQQPAFEQVRAEGVAVFGPDDAEPSRRAVDGGCDYTLAVLKEALRKYSVVPVVMRVVNQDDELMGKHIPAGTVVALVLQRTHKMYEQPDEFRPARFMPGGEYDSFPESERLFKFVPFIQGPRNCLGQHLAMLEARVVLSLLSKRFRFTTMRADAGERHPTVIPVGPKHPMMMLID